MIHTSLQIRPFSKEVPTQCIIPKSYVMARIYPVHVECFDIRSNAQLHKFEFEHGPLRQCTTTLDLEKGCVVISGFSERKFYQYTLDTRGLTCTRGGSCHFLTTFPGKDIDFSQREKLDLGCHKKQDVSLVFRRANIVEFLPIWYLLAESVPDVEDVEDEESSSLLATLRQVIRDNDYRKLSLLLTDIFLEAFTDLFLPRLQPSGRLGFDSSIMTIKKPTTALLFLKKSFPLLRSLFIEEKDNMIFLLPHLPQEMHAGKLLNGQAKDISISIEWTKHALRRVFFHAHANRSYIFKFSKDIKQYRLHLPSRQEIRHAVDGVVDLRAGESGFFDCFQR